ncbi:MAG TPA: toprim domain-containing protein [Polyangiales bacterium]|nr:toprim domain-containing protein [Polyangiales bacterium]
MDRDERLRRWQDAVESYKRDINLVEFAVSRGFQLRREKSTKRAKVLKHPNGDRILVAQNAADRHWVYYSIGGDDRDQGTVVDFLLRREAQGMKDVHNICREHLGKPREERLEYAVVPADTAVNRDLVAARFVSAHAAPTSRYLNERGIRPETLNDQRFAGTWRVDQRGNVLFPHRDEEGLCGYEVKNRGYTSFAAQGVKTVWRSRGFEADDRLVIAESAIDALSYHQLHGRGSARYASIGGAPSPHAVEQLMHSVKRLPAGARVILAVDHDAGGTRLAAQLTPHIEAAGRQALRHSPATTGLDWNAVLQRVERSYIASLQPKKIRSAELDMGLGR